MTAECPKCAVAWLEYEFPPIDRWWRDDPIAFRCPGCGARFEIEEDADYDGEGYVDCSTPGKEIT